MVMLDHAAGPYLHRHFGENQGHMSVKPKGHGSYVRTLVVAMAII